MIDILPTLALATSVHDPDRATIRTWSLVLSSRRFLNRFENGRLLVAPALAKLAVQEIVSYELENRPRPRPIPCRTIPGSACLLSHRFWDLRSGSTARTRSIVRPGISRAAPTPD